MATVTPSLKESPVVQALVVVALVAFSLFMFAETRNATAEYRVIGKPDNVRDTITMVGEGKVNAVPDIAQVMMGITSEGADVGAVQKMNTTKMNALIDAIKAAGIKDKDVQTQQYSIAPKYDWNNGSQKLVGYQVSQQVSVKVRDLDKVGALLTSAAQLGANQVGGLNFTFDDPSAIQAEARKEAIDDARKKANELAGQLGVQIVRVVSFSESGAATPVPMPMMAYAESKAMDAGRAPSIEVGSTDLMSNVSVTFEIR